MIFVSFAGVCKRPKFSTPAHPAIRLSAHDAHGKLLAELIALPSVNPSFLPPLHQNAGEKNVADFVAAMLSALCELADSKSRPLETEIVFAGLIDEEHAQAGSRVLVKNKFKGGFGHRR